MRNKDWDKEIEALENLSSGGQEVGYRAVTMAKHLRAIHRMLDEQGVSEEVINCNGTLATDAVARLYDFIKNGSRPDLTSAIEGLANALKKYQD